MESEADEAESEADETESEADEAESEADEATSAAAAILIARQSQNQEINDRQAKNMMVRKTSRKIRKNKITFVVGDKVSVSIPKEDRQCLQAPRLPGIISRVLNNG